MTKLPLEGLVVTEVGGREAVAVCGNLLSHLGAEVVVVEAMDEPKEATPRSAHRVAFMAGKRSLALDNENPADTQLLEKLLSRSDIVLASTDLNSSPLLDESKIAVLCDITAYGNLGPAAGHPATEIELQAVLGHMDTTGWTDGPPQALGFPLISYLTATYACAASVAAHRARHEQGTSQRVDIAMYDAAFLSLNAFLAGVLTGAIKDRGRLGNQHPTTPAWNLFNTCDGHVLICAGSQSQWLKLCDLIGQPDFISRFPSAQDRMANLPVIEAAIEAWTHSRSTAEAIEALLTAGIAAGPIAPICGYPREENLDHRGMIRDVIGLDGLKVAGAPVALTGMEKGRPARIPARGEDRDFVIELAERPRLAPAIPPAKPEAPLAGVRVIELGQYTTVPLCTRNLALLGADVIKVEKPGGDESRSYPPRQGERSEVYVMMNSSKRSIMLDLQKPEGKEILRGLLSGADILIENNKPGTLERYGLAPHDLQRDFPQLIHCAVSGFGINSIYGDRPGFDTVIQAMSGLMTAVNPGGLPLKTGISAADLMGSEMALVAVLAAMEQRKSTGRGQIIDLSMQDVACWVTEILWNQPELEPVDIWLGKQTDGFIVIDRPKSVTVQALVEAGLAVEGLARLTRAEAVALLRGKGIEAASVNSVKEATLLPQTQARALWSLSEEGGRQWPVLGDPLEFSVTKTLPPRRAPDLDADRETILASLH